MTSAIEIKSPVPPQTTSQPRAESPVKDTMSVEYCMARLFGDSVDDVSTTSRAITSDISSPTSDENRPTSDDNHPTSVGNRPTSVGNRPTSDGNRPTSDVNHPNPDSNNQTSHVNSSTSVGNRPTSNVSSPISDGNCAASGITGEHNTPDANVANDLTADVNDQTTEVNDPTAEVDDPTDSESEQHIIVCCQPTRSVDRYSESESVQDMSDGEEDILAQKSVVTHTHGGTSSADHQSDSTTVADSAEVISVNKEDRCFLCCVTIGDTIAGASGLAGGAKNGMDVASDSVGVASGLTGGAVVLMTAVTRRCQRPLDALLERISGSRVRVTARDVVCAGCVALLENADSLTPIKQSAEQHVRNLLAVKLTSARSEQSVTDSVTPRTDDVTSKTGNMTSCTDSATSRGGGGVTSLAGNVTSENEVVTSLPVDRVKDNQSHSHETENEATGSVSACSTDASYVVESDLRQSDDIDTASNNGIDEADQSTSLNVEVELAPSVSIAEPISPMKRPRRKTRTRSDSRPVSLRQAASIEREEEERPHEEKEERPHEEEKEECDEQMESIDDLADQVEQDEGDEEGEVKQELMLPRRTSSGRRCRPRRPWSPSDPDLPVTASENKQSKDVPANTRSKSKPIRGSKTRPPAGRGRKRKL